MIDFILHFAKHASAVDFRTASRSKVTDLSCRHRTKEDLARNSTVRGMQINFSEQFAKQSSSIRVNCDLPSKVTLSISLWSGSPEKAAFPRLSTDRGMVIDFTAQ
jgi:hypothetical protein